MPNFGWKIYGGCILKYNIVFMLLNILLVMETDAFRFNETLTLVETCRITHMDASEICTSKNSLRNDIDDDEKQQQQSTNWDILMRETKMMMVDEQTQRKKKQEKTHTQSTKRVICCYCCVVVMMRYQSWWLSYSNWCWWCCVRTTCVCVSVAVVLHLPNFYNEIRFWFSHRASTCAHTHTHCAYIKYKYSVWDHVANWRWRWWASNQNNGSRNFTCMFSMWRYFKCMYLIKILQT